MSEALNEWMHIEKNILQTIFFYYFYLEMNSFWQYIVYYSWLIIVWFNAKVHAGGCIFYALEIISLITRLENSGEQVDSNRCGYLHDRNSLGFISGHCS